MDRPKREAFNKALQNIRRGGDDKISDPEEQSFVSVSSELQEDSDKTIHGSEPDSEEDFEQVQVWQKIVILRNILNKCSK